MYCKVYGKSTSYNVLSVDGYIFIFVRPGLFVVKTESVTYKQQKFVQR